MPPIQDTHESTAHNAGDRVTVDSKMFAIGVLSVTACVLFVGLILVTVTPTPALGTGQIDRSGDYIMLTQQLSNSQEGVIIIDAASKQMSMYVLDVNQKKLRIFERNIPLDRLPGAAGRAAKP